MTPITILAAAEEELKLLPGSAELLYGSLMFVLLFVALSIFVFPKLNEGLKKRASKIQGQLEEAERTKRDADSVLEQYRQQVADARNEAARIVEEGRKAAEAVRAELVAKAQAEAESIVERARGEVAGERERAFAELKTTVGTLSLDIASKVIAKELASADAHRSLVDQAISELAGSANGKH